MGSSLQERLSFVEEPIDKETVNWFLCQNKDKGISRVGNRLCISTTDGLVAEILLKEKGSFPIFYSVGNRNKGILKSAIKQFGYMYKNISTLKEGKTRCFKCILDDDSAIVKSFLLDLELEGVSLETISYLKDMILLGV